MRATWRAGALALFLLVGQAVCEAASLRFCDRPAPLTAQQNDRMLRFAAIVKSALEDSGQGVALIARSGLDLSRFGQRYSHMGVSLKASANTPWSVRQLYFACDEGRPRVFDEGMAGFVLGMNDPAIGHVSVVLLPLERGAALERAALDDRRSVGLLGANYSANAHAFSLLYQNCNQWVAEMLAAAWDVPADDAADAGAARERAQRWLLAQGYRPSVFEVGLRPLMFVAGFVPWLHRDDHPADDLAQMIFRVSMPASIEAFVQANVPGASRIEFCQANGRVVVHRGWEPIAEGCRPGDSDQVVTLDSLD